jgi:type I phosphodiesterase/nucleotide pyrophosphatase
MILLITLDGLDSFSFDRAVQDGHVPAFTSMLQHSPVARLRPDLPPGSYASWVSLATGATPDEHGVSYPVESWAGGLRPTSRASWKRPPIWQILADQGYSTASVAFPCAGPGKTWTGVHVDDRIVAVSGSQWGDWPLPLDVAPDVIREDLRAVRVHARDITAEMAAPFEAAPDRHALAIALARSSTMFGAVEAVVRYHRPDFLAAHLDWPSYFTAALALQVGERLPTPFWTLLDRAIQRLTEIAGSCGTIILVSPGAPGRSGFMGAFSAQGSVRMPPTSPSLLDVTPTILARFGLSVPRLSGSVLLDDENDLRSVDCSWSTAAEEPSAADCSRVEAFGHTIPTPPPGWPSLKLLAEAELLLEKAPDIAAERVVEALRLSPEMPRALALAGMLAFSRRDLDALEHLADRMVSAAPEHLWAAMLRAGCHVLRKNAREAAPLLRRVEAEGSTDDRLRVAGAWLILGRGGEAERLFEAILKDQPDCIPALLGLASRRQGRPYDVEQLLRRVLRIQPDHCAAREALAEHLLAWGRSSEAAALR